MARDKVGLRVGPTTSSTRGSLVGLGPGNTSPSEVLQATSLRDTPATSVGTVDNNLFNKNLQVVLQVALPRY